MSLLHSMPFTFAIFQTGYTFEDRTCKLIRINEDSESLIFSNFFLLFLFLYLSNCDIVVWILWGDPLDKHELLTRTGLKPTVTFPLERGPYPAYTHGTDETVELYDDANSAKALAKDFLVYLGAITESEKTDWYVSMTEGAEQGKDYLGIFSV